MKSQKEQKNQLKMLIGLTMALGFTLCALEYGKPIGKYVFKGLHQDHDHWIESDPVQVTLRLSEPPKQLPKPTPPIAAAELLPNVFNIIDDADKRNELPVFDINPDDVYVPIEYIEEPHINPMDFPSVYPEFQGGEEALFKFLSDNLRYPKFARDNGIQGPVYIKFVVEADGSVREESIEILGSPHDVLSKEAIRVLLLMPAWKPGKQSLRNVPVNMKIPIKFLMPG